jgi:hypothetical protein
MRWYDLQTLLPPVYAGIKSMYATAESENTELFEAKADYAKILENFFVQTCDVPTLEYWENIMGIKLYGDETVESRRQMVLLYLANNLKITKPYVKQRMLELFGVGNYEFEYDEYNNLIVNVRVYDASTNAIKRFLDWFTKVCPAHIRWLYGHIENTQATNYISSGTTSHESVTTSGSMQFGTSTIYLGQNQMTVPFVEV